MTKREIALALVFALISAASAAAQATHCAIEAVLTPPLQSPGVVADELKHFMLAHIPALPQPASAAEWEKQAGKLRAHELERHLPRLAARVGGRSAAL